MKLYTNLRKEFCGLELTQKDIGKALGRSMNYVSMCLSGKSEWTISECYQLLRLIGRKPEEITEFFPQQSAMGSAAAEKLPKL